MNQWRRRATRLGRRLGAQERSRVATRWKHVVDRGTHARDAARLRVGLLPLGLKRLFSFAALAVILVGVGVTALLIALTASTNGCAESGLLCGIAGGFASSIGVFFFGFALVAVVAGRVVTMFLEGVAAEYADIPSSDSNIVAIVRGITSTRAASDVAPRIIVGQSGSGRSTLVAQLARDLVAAAWVPVVITLRVGAPFPGFRELARLAFLDAIDTQIASGEEGERIWRRVCGSGRLVLLVDDLHRIHSSEAQAIRAEFDQARDNGYALVATSRPHGVPRGLAQMVTDLGHMSTDSALRVIFDGIDSGGDDSGWRRLARDGIERGGFDRSPYYVTVLARLARAGALDSIRPVSATSNVDDLRRRVLDAFVGAYIEGVLAPDDHSTTDERRRALAVIELAAFDAVLLGERAILDPTIPGAGAALEAGLLCTERDGFVRVRHALLQNYLASRAIGDGPSWQTLLASRFQGSDVLATLRFWAAQSTDPARATVAYDALLRRSSQLRDARALQFVMTAARISRAAGLAHLHAPECRSDDALACAFAESWELGELSDRRIAVEQVAGLLARERFTTLGRCARDPDYVVRWSAAQALCGRVPGDLHPARSSLDVPALRSLTRPAFAAARAVELAIREGRENAAVIDDWDERVRPLVDLGWVLPVLGISIKDAGLRREVWAQFATMAFLFEGRPRGDSMSEATDESVTFTGITTQRGPEATMAQGLKTAATVAHAVAGDDPASVCALAERLCVFYGTTTFWYSRVVLLHGLAELSLTLDRLAIDLSDNQQRTVLVEMSSRTKATIEVAAQPASALTAHDADRHPFTVAAAGLANDALAQAGNEPDGERARTILRRYVWGDEAEVVASDGDDLDPRAVRLVGAITILLNLIERGDQQQRRLLPVRPDLPACLAAGEDQRRLLGDGEQASCECDFGLCSRSPPRSRDAVRQISKAFCRRAQSAADHKAQGWDPKASSADVRRFWREMEAQAER